MYTSASGKSYIGKTINEKRRKAQHKSAAKISEIYRKRTGCRLFYKAIAKYGFDNLIYTVLHSNIDNMHDLNTLEIEAIKKYNTITPYGYNLSYGGNDSLPSDETLALYKRRAEERVNDPIWLQKNAESTRKRSKNPEWLESNKKCQKKATEAAKQVICIPVFCLETGEIFTSITEASLLKGVHASQISKMLDGKVPRAGNLHWKEYNSDTWAIYTQNKDEWKHLLEQELQQEHTQRKENRRKVKGRAVICIDTCKVYASQAEASEDMCCSRMGIYECCIGRIKSTKGLHWKYYEE
jgi:hypothetical protein